jgi:hypothetical protein
MERYSISPRLRNGSMRLTLPTVLPFTNSAPGLRTRPKPRFSVIGLHCAEVRDVDVYWLL